MGREGGREWEVDGRKQAKVVEELLQGVVHKAWGSERVTFDCAPPDVIVLADCGFLRPPWDGGGRGEGSGKWMAATLDSVVALRFLFLWILDF